MKTIKRSIEDHVLAAHLRNERSAAAGGTLYGGLFMRKTGAGKTGRSAELPPCKARDFRRILENWGN